MKIVYIELDTHAEVLQDFYFSVENKEKVYFLVSHKIANRLNDIPVRIVQKKEILNVLKEINPGKVILGTLHRNFHIWEKIVHQYPCYAIIHNINFSKLTPLKLFFLCFKKDQIYRFKLLLKEKLLSSPCIHQALIGKWTMANFTFYIQRYTSEKSGSDLPILVIPGEVNQSRRDYLGLINRFLEAKNTYHLVFLGKCRSEMLPYIETLYKNHQVEWFKDRVSAQDFHSWMLKADLILCPIQRVTYFFSQKEIYGETKFSGVVADAVRYGKRVIFPDFYPVYHPLIFNEEKDWEGQIQQLLESSYHLDL